MFRWVRLAWSMAAVLAVTTAFVGGVYPAGTAAADAGVFVVPNPAAGDVPEGMLQALQRDLKVTPRQARERLVRSDWASRLEPQLRPRLGSAFAGSWLAEDGYEYVVAITDRRHEALVRASGATPKLVARSLAELTAIGDKLDKWAQGKGKVPNALALWTVDPQKNQVTVEHLPGGRAAAEAFVAASGVAARDVVYSVVPQRFQQQTDLKAGEGISLRQVFEDGTFRTGRCSAGFAVQDRQTGQLGFMTSAHCILGGYTTVHASPPRFPADGSNFGANYVGSVFRASYGGSDDEAFVRMRPAPPLWNPVAFVKGYKQPDIPVHDGTEQLPGSIACRSGITTGLRCGRIIAGEGYVVEPDGSIVSHLKQTDTCAEAGDSGGPVVSGVHAQGLHTGANFWATTCVTVLNALSRSFYVPVQRALGALDLALGTTTAAPTKPPAPSPAPTPNQKWFTGKQAWGGLGGAVKGRVASVTLNPAHVQIFGQGTDNRLYTNTSTDGVWSGWQKVGEDVLTEPPTALARTGGVIDVFFRGSDTRPYVRRWNGSAWEGAVKLGEIDVEGPITAVPLYDGAHAALFIRSSNNEVYFAGHDGIRWGSWVPLGGDVNAPPTAIARPNAAGQMILEVYARWANDNVRYRRTDPSTPGFLPWVNLGGSWKEAAPVGVSVGVDHSFVVGIADDHTLQVQQFRNGDWLRGQDGGITTGWRGVGGNVYSQPAVIAGPGERLRILARDINQQVNSIAWLGGDIRNWERWSSLDGDTGVPIGAGLRSNGQFGVIDAFGVDAATLQPLHTAIEAAPVPANVTPNKDAFTVGDAGFFMVTGPPGAPISWSSTKDGVPREDHAFYDQYLDANGTFTASAGDWDTASVGSWVKQVHVGTQNPQTAQAAFTVAPRPATIVTDKAHYRLGENITFTITGPANQQINASSTLNRRPSGVSPAFHGQYTDAGGVFTMTVPWTDARLGFWHMSINIAWQPAEVDFAVSNGSLAIYTESNAYGFGSFINYMVTGQPNAPTFWTTWLNGALLGNNVPGEPLDANGLLVTPEASWLNFSNGTYLVQVSAGGQTAQVSFVFDWPQPVAYPVITASHSNKCLDIEGNTADDGARALQATCQIGVNAWRQSGSALIATHSGKCLELASGNAGAPARQWTCNGTSLQQWQYFSATGQWWDHLFKVVSAGTGMCLTVADASLADGAAIVQMPCNGSANQVWKIPDPIYPPAPPPGWDLPV